MPGQDWLATPNQCPVSSVDLEYSATNRLVGSSNLSRGAILRTHDNEDRKNASVLQL